MIIYEMRATFGKLQGETLRLEPGLNILEAPNEWGKSTWCAFLTAMLFGVDTRAKTTKAALADKERYAPWSGSPMAGRIDLHWQGRDITIERTSRKRIPLGEFRAYETQTGLPVPELTAANCGQQLLGVEQSVFRRAGFIRFSDLQLTQDDHLRSRLNALVTTGDDSGDGEKLARALRDLKNTIQYNRKGLLPEAEERRAALYARLEEIRELESHCLRLEQRLEQLGAERQALENHMTHLRYGAYLENARRLREAQQEAQAAQALLQTLEAETQALPDPEETRQRREELRQLLRDLGELRRERELLPVPPREPEAAPAFSGPEPSRALQEDMAEHRRLKRRVALPFFLAACAALLAAALCLVTRRWVPGGIAAGIGLALLIAGLLLRTARQKKRRALEEKYGSADPLLWQKILGSLLRERQRYQEALADCQTRQAAFREKAMDCNARRLRLCPEQTPEAALEECETVLDTWNSYRQACREAQQARNHQEDLAAAVDAVDDPQEEDTLDLSAKDTRLRLEENHRTSQGLRDRLWQYQGQKEALGHQEELELLLRQTQQRIDRLKDLQSGLTIAQDTLTAAQQELQRRFAPRITRRAQTLLAELTGGRYRRLTLREDLSLEAEALEEDTLRTALWRSDGTVDQLYLALRLAVAEELTPGTPLILDDALVRFDDARLKAALKVLRHQAQHRQVLLFTCQSRERQLLEE